MLVLDFFMYTAIGIYLDSVLPREHGFRKPWMYICNWLTPTYWDCFDIFKRHRRAPTVDPDQNEEDPFENPNYNQKKFD